MHIYIFIYPSATQATKCKLLSSIDAVGKELFPSYRGALRNCARFEGGGHEVITAGDKPCIGDSCRNKMRLRGSRNIEQMGSPDRIMRFFSLRGWSMQVHLHHRQNNASSSTSFTFGACS